MRWKTKLSERSDDEPRRRFRKRWIAWALLGLWAGVGMWNVTKPMPAGTERQHAPRCSCPPATCNSSTT